MTERNAKDVRPRLVLLVLFTFLLTGCGRLVTSGNYTLSSGETLGGNLLVTSGNVLLEEDTLVNGWVIMTSGNLIANGEIKGDVFLTSGNASFGPRSIVHGNVNLTSGYIQKATGGRIEGAENSSASVTIGPSLIGFLCGLPALLVGLLVLFISGLSALPRRTQADQPRIAPGRTLRLLLGLILIGVGAVFLVDQLFDLDLAFFSWPLLFILAGLLFFAAMWIGGLHFAFLAIPGSILVVMGLILLYQNTFDHYESWAYAWALIFPGAVGLGLLIQAAWSGNATLRRSGRGLLVAGLLIFLVAGTFFELALNISGFARTDISRIVWPTLLILGGVYLLLRQAFSRRPKTPQE